MIVRCSHVYGMKEEFRIGDYNIVLRNPPEGRFGFGGKVVGSYVLNSYEWSSRQRYYGYSLTIDITIEGITDIILDKVIDIVGIGGDCLYIDLE